MWHGTAWAASVSVVTLPWLTGSVSLSAARTMECLCDTVAVFQQEPGASTSHGNIAGQLGDAVYGSGPSVVLLVGLGCLRCAQS